jgi:glutathione S-transferase
VMVTPEGACIRDSSAIVRYVSDRYAGPDQGLYPTAEVGELETTFANDLGAHTRRFAYFYLLADRDGLGRLADANAGPRQAAWFKRVLPVVTTMIARGLRVTPAGAARSLEKLRGAMAKVSDRIEGRPYLVGDRFTAADLAFACMAAPLLLPQRDEGYGAVLPPLEETPPAFAEIVREMRDTPAGRFALRMFREERGHA